MGKRLFIAILPDDRTRTALRSSQQIIAAQSAKARLTTRENLHLTLAFLGEQDEVQAEAIAEALQRTAIEMAGMDALRLSLGEIGRFSQRKGGAVLWRGIEAGPDREALERLRARLRVHLQDAGCTVASAYQPHFTLARGVRIVTTPTKEKRDVRAEEQRLQRLCEQIDIQAPAASFSTRTLSLMWSHRIPPDQLLTYTEIDSVRW